MQLTVTWRDGGHFVRATFGFPSLKTCDGTLGSLVEERKLNKIFKALFVFGVK